MTKTTYIAIFALLLTLACAPAYAMKGMDHGDMDHGDMDHGDMKTGETFIHSETVDGIMVEFQVMSLASMNMEDPDASHHVMATFMKGPEIKLEDVVARVKIISPSKEEQVVDMKNYSGTYAANFNVDEKGKYGVICLFKAAGEKHVVKFWYPNE